MIRLGTFEPKFFNNNGDQGNIEVLKYCLSNAGSKFEVRTEIGAADDFVLVGDASMAAMREFAPQLEDLIPTLRARHESDLPTLLVGRAYEFFAPRLEISLVFGERTSAFYKAPSDFGEVIGYHNSEVSEPKFYSKGLFIGTTLFGPLLAKNPRVLTAILEGLGVGSDLENWQMEYPAEIQQRTTFG